MADNRTMAQMLQAPIEGYEDAIVVPPINANNFELKQPLINLVQSNKFTDGEARDWLDKEPPRSILTWDDLVSKFINQFFPPSKTTYLRNKITNFFQEPNETFNEAWERFKGLLRQCPHHGFSELHQLDTFYNSLNSNDQDALDSAAGGNFLDKMPQEGGHKDHISACLCHMLYCIETSTPYNLAFLILKRMEKTRFKPKELLPYGMLLTRPREPKASSSSPTPNHPSSSHPLVDPTDENDDESSHSNPSSPSQNISSSSNNVSRVHQNPPRERHYLNTYLFEAINLQTQQKDAHREGLSHHQHLAHTNNIPHPNSSKWQPSKTLSTNDTSTSHEDISSSFQSKLQILPPSSHEPTSPQPLNLLLENNLDVPPRPSNPQPIQSYPSLDITLSLSPFENLEPPSPPQP
ncbi:reverse transcriptase domain-containing protein [Tanacetum coccineum]